MSGRLPLREHVVAGPAGELFVWDGGEGGLAVVFVHGLAGTLRHWKYQLTDRWRSGRALALDLRGHGRSALAVGAGLTVPELAADVVAVVDALDVERFVVVGHSLGASVALEVAASHGDRVPGVVLVDPTGDSTTLPERDVEALLAQVRADPRREFLFHYRQFLFDGSSEARTLVREDLDDTPDAVLVAGLEASMRYSPVAAVERYGGPSLAIVSPLNDVAYSVPRLCPQIPVVSLSGTSHWLMIDRPGEVERALGAFVEGLGT